MAENNNQPYRIYRMGNEERWRGVRELSQAFLDCKCANTSPLSDGVQVPCVECLTRIEAINDIATDAVAEFDGPSQ